MNGIHDPSRIKRRLAEREAQLDDAWLDLIEVQTSTKPKADKDKDVAAVQEKWADIDRKVKALKAEQRKVEGL